MRQTLPCLLVMVLVLACSDPEEKFPAKTQEDAGKNPDIGSQKDSGKQDAGKQDAGKNPDIGPKHKDLGKNPDIAPPDIQVPDIAPPDSLVPDMGQPDFPVPDQGPKCGNGKLESGEDCDGSNLNGKTCQSLNFTTGTLKRGWGAWRCATSSGPLLDSSRGRSASRPRSKVSPT